MPIIANKLGLKLSKKQRARERKATIIDFKTNDLWDLQEFREVFSSLNLNEPKLPPDLKRCFAYCSLFCPNHEFNRDDLLQLWEAEGFVQPQQTSLFDGFLSRSILHPYKTRGKKQGIYKMHEFNHKFAHLLASKVFCRVDEGTSNLLSSSENIRHLSIAHQNLDENLLQNIEQCEGLRTFLLLHQDEPITRTLSYNFFSQLKRLRLLDLSHTNFANLPEPTYPKPVFPSRHLRYLDLSYTEIKKLPKRIHILRALQILKLKNCSLRQLPKDMNQLISLKHFHVNMKNLGRPPSNLGELTNLETLDSFHVGKDKGPKVTELKNMDQLKEIHVSGLENIRDKKEAQDAMLSQKQLLRTLELEWAIDGSAENATAVFEGLQPHEHLDDLVVRDYCGREFPPWLISPTCQIVSIYLVNCQNCEFLPSLGQLPLLTTLVIHTIPKVKIVDDQFYGQGERVFPFLELLEFHNMEGLVNWTGLEAGSMPCLCTLKIISCPMLQSLPELPSSLNGQLGELIITDSVLVKERCQIGGADWQKFKEIPHVEIDDERIPTKSFILPPDGDKDKVPINEHHPSTSATLANENKVSQVRQDEVRRSKSWPNTPSRLGDENHILKVRQDEVPRRKIGPTTSSRLRDENHILKDEDQAPRNYACTPAFSTSQVPQQEGPSSEQPLPNAPPEPVDESPPCPVH